MASETEPAKLLLPYLQRADELQKHEPLVAYYCRLYAMERGLRIPQSERTKTTNALLVSLMNQLERDKKSLKLGPEDNLYLEGFALTVFAKADKQDHAGRADLNTAKTFYAASIFFEILNQFGALQPDLEQKQKYAVWKAADIRKALKEGRQPVPGPPGGGEDLSVPATTPSGSYDIGTSETPIKGPGSDSNPSSQFPDGLDNYSGNVSPPPQYPDRHDNYSEHVSPPQFPDRHDNYSVNVSPSLPQFHDKFSNQHRADIPPPPSHDFHPTSLNRSDSSAYSHPSAGYPPHDFHPPPPANRSENSTYSQPYQHQYSQEPQQHLPQGYPSQENLTFNYPNFQSYPSFTESSLPSVPSHYPSYHQGSETSYSSQSASPAPAPAPAPTTSYLSTSDYTSSSRNGTISEPPPISAQKYEYDSNYQPSPEKISEAHKAARFAVGALAFDDVSIAVDFLKKSLELLTNPSAGQ